MTDKQNNKNTIIQGSWFLVETADISRPRWMKVGSVLALTGYVSQMVCQLLAISGFWLMQITSSGAMENPRHRYLYTDEDTNTCVNATVASSLELERAPGATYLLKPKEREGFTFLDQEGVPYYAALLPACSCLAGTRQASVGTPALPVTYCLNKDAQSNELDALLDHLLGCNDREGMLVCIAQRRQETKGSYEDLTAIVEGFRQESDIENVKAQLQAQRSAAKSQRKDVFDELLDHPLYDPNTYYKIAFPFCQNNSHWYVGEIHGKKKDDYGYAFRLIAHNPYGGGNFQETFPEDIVLIRECLSKRLKIENLKVKSKPSPFKIQRQREGDGISCGPIMVDDLFRVILGHSLNVDGPPYEYGAISLRKKQIKLVKAAGSVFVTSEKAGEFLEKNERWVRELEVQAEPREQAACLESRGLSSNSANPVMPEKNTRRDDQPTPTYLPVSLPLAFMPDSRRAASLQGIITAKKAENETLEKLEEISRQISKIKENYKKVESGSANKGSLLGDIKESLLRISWRVDEIPGQSKFHMAPFIPERSWLLLGYLSHSLNSMANTLQMEEVAKGISEIEEAIPTIQKILKKELLTDSEKLLRHTFPLLNQFVMLDDALLHKVHQATTSLCLLINQVIDRKVFYAQQNNRLAVFRAFEIIGEGAKYITEATKQKCPDIPWLVPPPQKGSTEEGTKGNLLTTLRNKLHHERKKVELLFQYEPDLFEGLLDALLLIDSNIAKLINNPNGSDAQINPNQVKDTLTKIVQFLMDGEHPSLSGWEMEDLLKCAGSNANSLYPFLKDPPISKSEEEFIEEAQQAMSSPLSKELDEKLRRAYAKLNSKKLFAQDIEDAFNSLPSPQSIEDLKEKIRQIILIGEPCSREDFKKSYLNHLLFKDIDQSEGKRRLEKLRDLVSCDVSPDAINQLSISEEELERSYNNIVQKLLESCKIQRQLEALASLKKNALDKGKLHLLVGISQEDKEFLLKVLAKEPSDIREEDVSVKIKASREMCDEVRRVLAQKEKFGKSEKELRKILHISKREQEEIGRILSIGPDKRNEKQVARVKTVLSGCIQTFDQYKEQQLRTPYELKKVSQILQKLPKEVDGAKPQGVVVDEFLKRLLRILRQEEDDPGKEAFYSLVDLFPSPSLTNKIKAKYKKIFCTGELKEELEKHLATIHTKHPFDFLREILENEWIREESKVTEKQLREATEEAGVVWEYIAPLLDQKRRYQLTEDAVEKVIKDIRGCYLYFMSEDEEIGDVSRTPALKKLKNDDYKLFVRKENGSISDPLDPEKLGIDVRSLSELWNNKKKDKEFFQYDSGIMKNILTKGGHHPQGIWRDRRYQNLKQGASEKISALVSLVGSLLSDLSEITQKDFDKCVEEAKLDKDLSARIKSLYCRKTNLPKAEIEEIMEKLDEILASREASEKIGALVSLVGNLLPDLSEIKQKDFDKCVEEAKLDKDLSARIKSLYCRKTDLPKAEIEEIMGKLDEILAGQENQKKVDVAQKESLFKVKKIYYLKDIIKKTFFISKKEFEKLVIKAGGNLENWKHLYRTIASTDEIALQWLTGELQTSINKLDPIFDALCSGESINGDTSIPLKMSAAYLLEEIGQTAGTLVYRSDYQESDHLSTSRRNFYLMEVCRKAMAHYPLSIDENLMSYLIDQLVLDTKLRLDHSQSTIGLSAEGIGFEKSRRVTWGELEQKKTEIYAVVEGLGFKSDFKIFGKNLDCDIGPQGNLNLIVEYDGNETNNEFQYLTELETRLSRELHCDVRAYTYTTLENRLKPKVTSEHLQEIKEHATHTLEDIILGNTFVRIFQEDRWSSFRTSDGRIFTRSDFLEQKDIRRIFKLLLGSNFSFEQMKDILNDKEKLQGIIQEKLSLYNSFPNQHASKLEKILKTVSFVVPLYETGFQCIYIPIERREEKIHYEYFRPFGQTTNGAHLTIGDLPSKWEGELPPPIMQLLYSCREQDNGSQAWIRCDTIFTEALTSIQEGKEVSDLVCNDIANLLFIKKDFILKALSSQNIINENNIFRAVTMDYAYNKKELEEDRKRIENSKRKKMEENQHLKNIIKDKSSKYCNALMSQLSFLSPQVKEYLLKYVLWENKTDELLRVIYRENQDEVTSLWRIMDHSQKNTFSRFIEKVPPKTFVSKIQHIKDSFFCFKINIKHNLSLLRNKGAEDKITSILKEQTKIIQDIESALPENPHHLFNRPRKDIAIELAIKYTSMFLPIKNPQIIQSFLNGKSPSDLIYLDLCNRYCQAEEPCTILIINREGTEKAYTMADFSGEVEYQNYERKKQNKAKLEKQKIKKDKKHNRDHHLKFLRRLVNEGRGKKLEEDQETLSGFVGKVHKIYHQVTSLHTIAQPKPMVPTLLIEELPNNSSVIGMALGSYTESKTMFSNEIEDLNHLMNLYGWSEEGKKAYRAKNQFLENDKIIKEYFCFKRLSEALRIAQQRKNEYRKKRKDIQEKLNGHRESYTFSQQEKLASDGELYKQALEKNRKNQELLREQVIESSYLKRKISEALRDPDFLNDLSQSGINIKERIDKKREELKAKALSEISKEETEKFPE